MVNANTHVILEIGRALPHVVFSLSGVRRIILGTMRSISKVQRHRDRDRGRPRVAQSRSRSVLKGQGRMFIASVAVDVYQRIEGYVRDSASRAASSAAFEQHAEHNNTQL
jgi:hypothetical protein